MNEIDLTSDDYRLIIELVKLGSAPIEDIAFATGDFNGELTRRVSLLLRMKLITSTGEGDNVTFSATGDGLVQAHYDIAYHRGLHAISRRRIVAVKHSRLQQRHASEQK